MIAQALAGAVQDRNLSFDAARRAAERSLPAGYAVFNPALQTITVKGVPLYNPPATPAWLQAVIADATQRAVAEADAKRLSPLDRASLITSYVSSAMANSGARDPDMVTRVLTQAVKDKTLSFDAARQAAARTLPAGYASFDTFSQTITVKGQALYTAPISAATLQAALAAASKKADQAIMRNWNLAGNTPAKVAARADMRAKILSEALAASGVTDLAMMGDALAAAVKDKKIDSAMVQLIAAKVAPKDPLSQTIILQGSSYTAPLFTASTDNTPSVSALINLSSVATPGAGRAGEAAPPAPFDPCAGVIAGYCG